ncbi:glutathione S-transferase family protein [Amorphus orientalis]|uniref:Glutathione S-transferase n=1 Tax=Amorphus orientalis TaxID=649198 RepID=A0AAE4AUG5_9HYPH|nr:glutathione binding-like protein [Amorphus orientalis]MDQ0317413.1 glutathione S-transferase [Amorphus orientalis]
MDKIRLLGRQTSGNVQKVIWMLEELGAPYVREDYGRQFGNTQTSEYLALNPNAKVPTVIDGDLTIWESNTILRYLAATRGAQLTGATPGEATEVERWMDWLLGAVNAPYLTLFKESKLAPEERTAAYGAASKEMDNLLAIAEAHMEGKEFAALGKLTIADIALAPVLKRCMGFDIERKPTPNLDRWMESLLNREGFQVALGERQSTNAAAA